MPDKIPVLVYVAEVEGGRRWHAPSIGVDVTAPHNADAAYAFMQAAQEHADYERYSFEFDE
jgi:hypothetical protein